MQCKVSLAAVKKEASHESELYTQLLFGQLVEFTGNRMGTWAEIRCEEDAQLYYVLQAQLQTPDTTLAIRLHHDARILESGNDQGYYAGSLVSSQAITQAEDARQFSVSFIRLFLASYVGVPYFWGGLSTAGIDCSGLSKLLYLFAGIALPHSASQQMQAGDAVDFIQQVQCGDLAFFVNDDDEVNHVGILLSEHEIIHTSATNGMVAIDEFDQEGIIFRSNGKRGHRLRMIKRLIPELV